MITSKRRLAARLLRVALLPGLLVAAWGAAPVAAVTPMGAGTEGRDWILAPGLPRTSPARYPLSVEDGFEVEMRDGIRLEGRLYRPLKPPGPVDPCLVSLNGYGMSDEIGAVLEVANSEVAERGTPVFSVSMRGTGGSEGEHVLYENYSEDGHDVIEWVALQPWCNGRVGTIGASLLGITQWLAAKAAPPSLETFAPLISAGDNYWYVWYPGGMLPGPGRVGRGPEEFDPASEHRDLDEFWERLSTRADDHAAIAERGVPVFIVDGWNDYFLPANVRAYEELRAVDGEAKLILGPWTHIDAAVGADLMPYNLGDTQQAWFDHRLRDIPNGIDTEPRVILYVEGPNLYRFEPDWPIAEARSARLYLREGPSQTIASRNDGALGGFPAEDDAPASVPYDPVAGPFLSAGSDTVTGRPKQDLAPQEEQLLTYTSEPLEEPAEVTGWPTLVLWAESSAVDADLVVVVSDVGPDGSSRHVMQGYLNAPHSFSRSDPVALVPGKVNRYDVEIWPTSYVFDAGHRIRVDVAGGASTAPGQLSPQGPGRNPLASTWTLHTDRGHASYLELPIVGSAVLPGEAGPDADADGVADAIDNCVHAPNTDQLDRGGLATDEPDGIGDACQCGDVSGNGIVNGQDGNAIRRHGLGAEPNPLFVEPGNCDVSGNDACNGQDANAVRRAALGSEPNPLFGQRCHNALGTPIPPDL